ncbi:MULTISPECIES: hypothetical protein [unclassified Micromonospora]|uniref:hypothetical protein n=1 Tax=unclassified Micromonospora TaxID=2617518 RepID=UPI002FF20295
MAGGDPDASLRPVRWLRRPGGGTLLRLGLVAALLGLAVIILDSSGGCPTPAPNSSAGGAPPGGAGPADDASGGGPSDGGSSDGGSSNGSQSNDGPSSGGPSNGGPSDGGPSNGGPSGEGSSGGGVPGAGRSGGGGRPGALPLPSGSVGVPVRLAEPAALAVLQPGARVDLLVVPAGRTPVEAGLLASGALVLDVVGGDVVDGSSALYLALRPDQAQRAVAQPEGSRFAVVVRG